MDKSTEILILEALSKILNYVSSTPIGRYEVDRKFISEINDKVWELKQLQEK